jgi:hypothetical protein
MKSRSRMVMAILECDKARLDADHAQILADAEKARSKILVTELARMLRRDSDFRAGRKPNERKSTFRDGCRALREEPNQYQADVDFIHQQLVELMGQTPLDEASNPGSSPVASPFLEPSFVADPNERSSEIAAAWSKFGT